jgi:hypothetical protein
MCMIRLAILVTLVLVAAAVPGGAGAQETSSYRYDERLALVDAGAWPLERLAAVAVDLEEITVSGAVTTWWVWVTSTETWAPHPTQTGRCCVLELTPTRIDLVDAAGQRYAADFGGSIRHRLPPGSRTYLLANFRGVPPEAGPFTLHLEADVRVATVEMATPGTPDDPVCLFAAVDACPDRERDRARIAAAEAAFDPKETIRWVVEGVRLP